VANGPKRRLRGGELAEHPGGELPEHFSSAWWNYLNADNLAYVAERLGHANIGTTGVYLHLQNADMKAALQDYAARRQGKSP